MSRTMTVRSRPDNSRRFKYNQIVTRTIRQIAVIRRQHLQMTLERARKRARAVYEPSVILAGPSLKFLQRTLLTSWVATPARRGMMRDQARVSIGWRRAPTCR